MLARFVSLIEEIQKFFEPKKQNFDQLSDPFWLIDLGFPMDVMDKFNTLNLIQQGKEKHIAVMIGSGNLFNSKQHFWISHLKIESLVHFQNMN